MLIINDRELLATLHRVYEFEVPRVSGPHGGMPGFKPWSREDFLANHPGDSDILDRLIELLKDERQIMVIPANGKHPERYLTRTAEMVRTLGTIHEYVARETEEEAQDDSKRHLQLIEATKWVPALMERPDRVVPVDEFIDKLRDDL